MSTAAGYPSEIIEEILYRLPVKSLGRFKLVSKPWRSLISEPQFVTTHFNRNSSRYRENTIGVSSDRILYSYEVEESVVNARKLHPSWIFSCHRPCLCNGLVLAYRINNDSHSPILINPTTREYSILHLPPDPNLPLDFFDLRGYQAIGLGYDSRNDDYKFVRLTVHPSVEGKRYLKVTIYSLRTNCSRETIVPMISFFARQLTGVCLNGRLHWLCHLHVRDSADCSCFIAAFNLESEEFEEVQLPRSLRISRPCISYRTLHVVKGRLICISYDPIDIWVLEDQYGATEYSWRKIPLCGTIMDTRSLDPPLLCLMNGGEEVVLQVDWHNMVAYNVEDKTSRDLEIRGVPAGTVLMEFRGTYIESLVSPQCVIGRRI